MEISFYEDFYIPSDTDIIKIVSCFPNILEDSIYIKTRYNSIIKIYNYM